MSAFLEQELAEQPEAVARLFEREAERAARIVAALPPFSYAMIAASAAAAPAATYAAYVWAALAGFPVAPATPALHTLYAAPPRLRDALVVGISPSGQSPAVVAVVEEGRRQSRPTLAITNDGASPLAAAADHVIALHAGAARSLSGGALYATQLAALAMLGVIWSGDRDCAGELGELPEILGRTLAGLAGVAAQVDRLRSIEEAVVIGYGYNDATACELARNLRKLAFIRADAYTPAAFRRGPFAAGSSDTPAILAMPSGAALADMRALAADLAARGAELLVISDDPAALAAATTPLPLPAHTPEWLSPIAAILPGQLLALRLAHARVAP